MRYTPNTSSGSGQFNPGRRPPLELVPAPIAAKLKHRDQIMERRAAAHALVEELRVEAQTSAARSADDATATKAARAGKPVPAPTALPKLEQARADAAHAAAAHDVAFIEVTAEVETICGDTYWARLEADTADRDKVRADLTAQAAALADAVEAAVAKFAAIDWLQTGVYDKGTQTWPTEILDLARYGLDRKNTSPVDVRAAIIAAATTLLDPPA